MENELIDYLTLDSKLKMAKRLLRSALVYNHVKDLMLKKNENNISSDSDRIEKKKERENFDKTRDYASVIREEYILPDRLRNYHKILAHERSQMDILLKTKEVCMLVVKDILNEEGLDQKKYFNRCCNRLLKNLNPSFSRRIVRHVGKFLRVSSHMNEKS